MYDKILYFVVHISKNILTINNRTIKIITVICFSSFFNENFAICDDYNNKVNNSSNNYKVNEKSDSTNTVTKLQKYNCYAKYCDITSNNISKITNNPHNKSNINNILETNHKYNNIKSNSNSEINNKDSSNVTNRLLNKHKKRYDISSNNNIKLHSKNLMKDSIIHNILTQYKEYDDEFNIKLDKYIKLATKVSYRKKITRYNINKLLESALIVLDHIKFNNLYKKFNNVSEIIFKSTEELHYNNKFEESVIKFTVSFFYVFTTLNKKHVIDIIIKAPLELVPLLKEMNVFAKFITSTSHYAIKNGDICEIIITKNNIMRIMGTLIKVYLIEQNSNNKYKLSNIASIFFQCKSFYNPIGNNNNETVKVLYKNTINKLHRSIDDNKYENRITLYSCK